MRKASRPLLTGVLVWAWLAGTPDDARACSCMKPGPPCEAFWKVSAVFVGRVTEIMSQPVPDWQPGDGPPPLDMSRRITLAVVERLVGNSGTTRTVDITTGSGEADCGVAFERGREYIVYARAVAGRPLLSTNICTGTRPLEEAADDVAYGRQLMTAEPHGPAGMVTGTLRHVESGPAGWVVDDPLSGVTIRLSGDHTVAETRTLADGRFSLSGLPVGRYTVEVVAPDGFYARVWPSIAEIGHYRGCADVVAQVRFDGRIAGTIVRDDDTPVVGATITAYRLDDGPRPSDIPPAVVSDSAGHYELREVPPGRYRVALVADSGTRGTPAADAIYHPGVKAVAQATTLDLLGGQRVVLPAFTIGPELRIITIRGRVIGPDGTPAPGSVVYLARPEGGLRLIGRSVRAGEDGRFQISAPYAPAYRLLAEFTRAHGEVEARGAAVVEPDRTREVTVVLWQVR